MSRTSTSPAVPSANSTAANCEPASSWRYPCTIVMRSRWSGVTASAMRSDVGTPLRVGGCCRSEQVVRVQRGRDARGVALAIPPSDTSSLHTDIAMFDAGITCGDDISMEHSLSSTHKTLHYDIAKLQGFHTSASRRGASPRAITPGGDALRRLQRTPALERKTPLPAHMTGPRQPDGRHGGQQPLREHRRGGRREQPLRTHHPGIVGKSRQPTRQRRGRRAGESLVALRCLRACTARRLKPVRRESVGAAIYGDIPRRAPGRHPLPQTGAPYPRS
jgi:hypothetical protein